LNLLVAIIERGKKRADFWVLGADGKYQPVPVGADGIYRSTVIPDFWLRVDWLWSEEKPDPLSTFAEIVGPARIISALQQLIAQGPSDGPVNGKAEA
jgi:hypothetical protein